MADPNGRPVRVLIVDDEPMVCAFLRTILDGSGHVEVIGTAEDGAAAVESVIRDRPDVVLMDLRMPGVDGVAATAEVRSLPEPPVVVVMTTFDTDDHLLAALDAGAAGYLLKSTPTSTLVQLVLAAAAGASVLSPEAVHRLRDLANSSTPTDPDPQLEALSGREREILALLGEGLSNADIARRLYLSEGTIKGHVSRLMADLDCQNRTQLALRATASR
ncbi:two component transcriptional regulator, LuxR family [Kribbella flavida DSM 17836]|uniref:Two component transcriptional regulator, LuxR family n=1 Tax=Kribbella flavida (strain DSM 17836 / JCM 10339 / NBRC 14399) TaxID=479435 RepID=D2PVA7_KRIFD|nr:response regulator transcription factor [Kribbella flavida]ADB33388.1 two component transcriptional regulator, LuxR family [Kribbella flavida DSM 17836]